MKYASFYVGDDFFGIPIEYVQEIERMKNIYPVPGHGKQIAGVVDLRGAVAAVIALRNCLFMDKSHAEVQNYSAVILEPQPIYNPEKFDADAEDVMEPVVLMVDRVGQIFESETNEIYGPPAHVREEYVEGVVKVDGVLLTLLSIPKLIRSIVIKTGEVNESAE